MHLHTICDNAIACYPDKIAIQGDGYAISYRELVGKADNLAQHWIASGFQIGERIALWLPNCPEALIAYLACFRAGLIAVALDFRYRPETQTASISVDGAAPVDHRIQGGIVSAPYHIRLGENLAYRDYTVPKFLGKFEVLRAQSPR